MSPKYWRYSDYQLDSFRYLLQICSMTVITKLSLLFTLLLTINNFSYAESENRILNYVTDVKVEKGKLITEKSFFIEVADQSSDWISDISIYYDKNDELEILEAVILDHSGKKIRKLSDNEVLTRSDISYGTFYQDGLVKEFSLKWNKYPYRIRYSYRKVTSKFLYVAHWFPILYNSVMISKATLNVELPADYEVSMSFSDDFSYEKEVSQRGKSQKYSWNIENYRAKSKERFSPPIREIEPKVILFPKKFIYGVEGSSENWQEYGLWHENLNSELEELSQSEKKVVDELLIGISDTKEKIKTLYNYMQDHTRYINVAIDVGGMKPFPATYVCKNKYGDCKALTIYMKALLNYIGIPSYYSVINSGENPERINKDLPSQQFDHVILCVPVESDTLWLENTSSYTPYNYLGSFTQNRSTLLVNGNKSALVKTPAMSASDVLESKTYHFELNEQGEGTLQMNGRFQGEIFEYFSYSEKHLKQKEQEEYLNRLVGINRNEVIDWEVNIPDRNMPYAEVQVRNNVSNQFRNLGELLAISLLPLKNYDLEKPEDRKLPLRITMPVNRVDTVVYQLSFMGGYEVELPAALDLENQFGRLEVNYSMNDSQIRMYRTFQLHTGDYSLEEYENFYNFLEQIEKYHRKSKIILQAND